MNAIARIPTDAADNPRGVIGNNGAPAEPTPFERCRDKINGLYDEAKLYLDGEPVNSQGMADDITNLRNMIRAAAAEAEEARKVEVKPFDDGKAEVQARYNPLIADTKAVTGITVQAVAACNKALEPWLTKLDEEKKDAAAEAQRVADEKRAAAEAAIRSRDATNLEQSAAAEALLKDAKKAGATAKKAAKDSAKAGSGIGRAASLRTSYRAVVTDERDFARHVWANHRAEMAEFLNLLAARLVAAGSRDLPGVTVHTETKVV